MPVITVSFSTSTPAGMGALCSGAPQPSTVMTASSLSVAGLVAQRDRHADQRAVFGPRAVVVAHIVVAEQLLEHEPRVRRALADAAVGDRRLAVVQPGGSVELAQVVVGLERAVFVG